MVVGRGARAGRAAGFAAVCVLLAGLGHALTSGTPIPWWAGALAFTATAGAAWLAAGCERGRLAVTALTVGVQACLHAVFSLGQVTVGPRAPSGTLADRVSQLLLCHGRTASATDAARLWEAAGLDPNLLSGTGGSPPSTSLPGSAGVPLGEAVSAHQGGMLLAMTAAHLLAALGMGLWLAAGERAFFRICDTAAARLLAPLFLLLRHGRAAHRPLPGPIRTGGCARLRSQTLVHAITSRGPPGASAAV